MTAQIERRAAPSLLGNRAGAPAAGPRIESLVDLMHEGFYVLFMLKNGSAPPGEHEFAEKVSGFLNGFEAEARRLRAHGEDIEAAKYAYCAALDEIILASGFPIREPWERRPLQLTVFGDQLAGSTSSTGSTSCAAKAARGCRRCRCFICACCSASRANMRWTAATGWPA